MTFKNLIPSPSQLNEASIDAEREKCRNDFFYWLENYCQIDGKPVVLTEAQKIIIHSLLDLQDNQLTYIPRPMGLSTMTLIVQHRKDFLKDAF